MFVSSPLTEFLLILLYVDLVIRMHKIAVFIDFTCTCFCSVIKVKSGRNKGHVNINSFKKALLQKDRYCYYYNGPHTLLRSDSFYC